MKSKEILEKYVDFWEQKDHKLIPNVSLVPENDPTLLFVNSGMFPLVNYMFGEKHPLGKRLVNVQRCVRFEDLADIGDATHTVAFHMIGNWSLGDYFKTEQLPWMWEFFVEVLGLDINKLYGTVFSGNEASPKDEEAIQILKNIYKKYGIDAKENERIFAYKKDNWWSRGEAVGEPGGPTSEVFYYIGKEGNGEGLNPAEHDDKFVEIGNSVFMQFKLTDEGWKELEQKNVDFGGGLERIALSVQGKSDIFETDNFWPIIEKLEKISGKTYNQDENAKKNMRILSDHMRTAVLLAMDGVKPSNKDQGYVLRRILRKMIRTGYKLNIEKDISISLYDEVVGIFGWIYPQLVEEKQTILEIFTKEEEKFRKVLEKGMRESEKILKDFSGDTEELSKISFDMYQSMGYPIEMFLSDLEEKQIVTNLNEVEKRFTELVKEHQEKSRAGAEQKFTGGLADQSEQTIKYHTTTHLLHWALREVLGDQIHQSGSNITGERLRFDINHDKKLTQEQIKKVEDMVNEKIQADLPMNNMVLDSEEAIKRGALHFFDQKYPDKVTVYYIGDDLDSSFSKEFCGGPHVSSLGEIGNIEIFKQKKIGKTMLRIYVRNM